jgi:two-component system, NtrC family, nitrogen regulation sensor histidine kinase GlnL
VLKKGPHAERRHSAESLLAGLDLLATAVALLDAEGTCIYVNLAALATFEFGRKGGRTGTGVVGTRFSDQFSNGAVIEHLLEEAANNSFGQKRQDIVLDRPGKDVLHLHCTAVVLESSLGSLLLEFREFDSEEHAQKDERSMEAAQANRELIRNLAHEIKNPLGGIRGAAQLLELDLPNTGLRDYTQVIIKEADRLQSLVDRLLAPHRHTKIIADVNIHEVCERVRSVVLAEYPSGVYFVRDYDASLPDFRGDKEQLIQTLLNLVRNACEAFKGRGTVHLKTRVARQVTIAKQRYRLALDLHVIDDGPGIPDDIKDRIFFPLVSGRDGGSGLGLSIAQTFIQQHNGSIECKSSNEGTDFRILLPLP